MPHHYERFGAALGVLAGHGHIKSRLIKAFDESLADIDDASLPEAMQESFCSLRERLTSVVPSSGEGAVCASVRKMSIVEADECARTLVELFAEVVRAGDDAGGETVAPVEAEVEVPAVLLKSV